MLSQPRGTLRQPSACTLEWELLTRKMWAGAACAPFLARLKLTGDKQPIVGAVRGRQQRRLAWVCLIIVVNADFNLPLYLNIKFLGWFDSEAWFLDVFSACRFLQAHLNLPLLRQAPGGWGRWTARASLPGCAFLPGTPPWPAWQHVEAQRLAGTSCIPHIKPKSNVPWAVPGEPAGAPGNWSMEREPEGQKSEIMSKVKNSKHCAPGQPKCFCMPWHEQNPRTSKPIASPSRSQSSQSTSQLACIASCSSCMRRSLFFYGHIKGMTGISDIWNGVLQFLWV